MSPNLEIVQLDQVFDKMLRAARIPGGGIAVVAAGKTIYAKGFGYRDLKRRRSMKEDTAYPIASTTKAFNATLLGMLVDEGLLEWDAPVQRYLSWFRLSDSIVTPRVTIRDLVTMQTGLPRHDWVWMARHTSRAELMACLAHLEPSADLRQRFQYSNLSVVASGHVAEIVADEPWESLVRRRILAPLGMRKTTCFRPRHGNVTLSYHESAHRKLLVSRQLRTEHTAPSGGAIYSTLFDMARWIAFNLDAGRVGRRALVSSHTMQQIHAPQVVIGDRPLGALPIGGSYGYGWAIDTLNGVKRLSHGGYIHDVSTSVMLFPELALGMVSFVNFGASGLAETMNLYAFHAMTGSRPAQTYDERLALYEKKIDNQRRRRTGLARKMGTRPSQPLSAYAGLYQHAAYGDLRIRRRGRQLVLGFRGLRWPLEHWHHDAWLPEDSDRWGIHAPHAFDGTNLLQFHMNPGGEIATVSLQLDSEVPAIQFVKR